MPPRQSKKPLSRFTIYIPKQWDDLLEQIATEKTAATQGAVEYTKAAISRLAIKEYLEKQGYLKAQESDKEQG